MEVDDKVELLLPDFADEGDIVGQFIMIALFINRYQFVDILVESNEIS